MVLSAHRGGRQYPDQFDSALYRDRFCPVHRIHHMSRLTVAEAKGSLCRAVDNGVPADDPRVIQRINEATERLMAGGHWVGMTQELLICTQQQCFTLPRQIESVQEVFILDQTLDVSSGWYSIENASTYVDPEFLNDVVLIDRGEYPAL